LPNIIEKMYNDGGESLKEDERIVLAMFTEDKNIACSLDVVLSEFASDIEVAMQDDDLKESYDHFLDYRDGMRKEGFEEGLEQGKKDSTISIAKKMLDLGYKKEDISKIYNISIQEIDELLANNKEE